MFDKIGTTYATVSSVLGIIIGLLIIIYHKRFLNLLKSRHNKQGGILNEHMLKNWESRPESDSHRTIVIVGIVLVIISILHLLKLSS
jgi:hypothetical protein